MVQSFSTRPVHLHSGRPFQLTRRHENDLTAQSYAPAVITIPSLPHGPRRAPSRGRCRHYQTVRYISIVHLHAKLTRWHANDFTAQSYTRPPSPRPRVCPCTARLVTGGAVILKISTGVVYILIVHLHAKLTRWHENDFTAQSYTHPPSPSPVACLARALAAAGTEAAVAVVRAWDALLSSTPAALECCINVAHPAALSAACCSAVTLFGFTLRPEPAVYHSPARFILGFNSAQFKLYAVQLARP